MAVAFDAVGPSATGVQKTTSPITWSHTCGASATLIIATIVVVHSSGLADTGYTTSATYNGVTMLAGPKQSSGASALTGSAGFVQSFYLFSPPTGSALTVSVAVTGSTIANLIAGSVSFTGAVSLGTWAQTFNASSAGATLSIPSTTSGNMCFAALCDGSGGESWSAGTSRWKLDVNTSYGGNNATVATLAAPGGTASFTWSESLDAFGIAGVEIRAGGSAPVAASARPQQRAGKGYRRRLRRTQRLIPADPIVSGVSATATPAVINAVTTIPAVSAGSILLVQSATNSVYSAIANTLTVTLPNPTVSGNCLTAKIGLFGDSSSPTTVSITIGGSADNWTAGVSSLGSTAADIGIWVDPSCVGGQSSVVITGNGTGGQTMFATVEEWAGLSVSPVDKSSVVRQTSATASWSSGITATASQPVELLLGAAISFDITADFTLTGPVPPWVNGAISAVHNTYWQRFVSGSQVIASAGTAEYAGTASYKTSAAVLTLKAITATASATATPSVVAITASFGASPANAGSSAAPAVVSITTTIPVPVISVSARPAPATVAVASLISVPVPSASSRAPPAVIAAPAVVPVPALATSAQSAPAVVGMTSTIPVPAVIAGSGSVSATAAPACVSAVVSIPVPSVSRTAVAAPANIAGTVVIAGNIAGSGAVTTPSGVLVSITVPTPQTAGYSRATPTVVAASTSVPAPAVASSSRAAPAVVASATSIATPSVSAGGNATATPAVIAVAVAISGAASSSSRAAPSVVASQSTVPTPASSAGATATPSGVVASTAITTPSIAVSVSANAHPAVVGITTAIPSASASVSVLAHPAAVAASTTIPAPAVKTSAVVLAVTISAVTAVPSPRMSDQSGYGTSDVGGTEPDGATPGQGETSDSDAASGATADSETTNPVTAAGLAGASEPYAGNAGTGITAGSNVTNSRAPDSAIAGQPVGG